MPSYVMITNTYTYGLMVKGMKKLLVGILLFFALVNVSYARGIYVGAKYMLLDTTISVLPNTYTASPTGFAIFGGKTFSSTFAIEGTVLLNGPEANIDNTSIGKLNLDSFADVTAVFTKRFSREFQVDGRLGAALIKWKDSDGNLSDTWSTIGFTIAGNASYFINRDIRFFIEYQFLPDATLDNPPSGAEDDNISASAISIGGSARF